jgi:hypothetical protein
VTPSSARDLQNDELRPLIDRFYRGSTGDAHDRMKLFKLIWDAVGTEFGARHEWYEINYSGNREQMRLDMLRFSGSAGSPARRMSSSSSACRSTTSTGGPAGRGSPSERAVAPALRTRGAVEAPPVDCGERAARRA